MPGPLTNRRTGKIARLPKDVRDVVNLMLRDGAQYLKVQQQLEKMGHKGITEVNITAWYQGGYQDWLGEQERLEEMKAKREFAFDTVKANEGTKVTEAATIIAAQQLYEVLVDFDVATLKQKLDGDPENYAAIVNALAKLSKSTLELEKYKSAMRKANEEIQKLRNPQADLSDTERTAVLDKVDEILGLK